MIEKVLITGGAGFIGSNAARILVDKGYEVIALDDLTLGCKENLPANVKFVKGDACDAKLLESVGPVDYVIPASEP